MNTFQIPCTQRSRQPLRGPGLSPDSIPKSDEAVRGTCGRTIYVVYCNCVCSSQRQDFYLETHILRLSHPKISALCCSLGFFLRSPLSPCCSSHRVRPVLKTPLPADSCSLEPLIFHRCFPQLISCTSKNIIWNNIICSQTICRVSNSFIT